MTGSAKVVVIDDDSIVLRAVGEILRRDGYQPACLSDPREALALVADSSLDVVVCDMKMPNLSGLELLKVFKGAQPDVEVIIMTGHATVEAAVEAVKAGAYAYLTKPFERIEDFSLTVAKAIERRTLKRRTSELEDALSAKTEFEGMLGQSSQMRAVFKLAETVAASTASVLIQGESGTGKELVARAIHRRSPRATKPFIAVNCSALTETLLDSELFGHVKGAFTGALSNKKGFFEAADGGTIFLDEIGDVSPATQVRLLRVLQEGEIRRVGSNDSTPVDVRLIAASNVDLFQAKTEGRFREDLYYRLNVVTLKLPPLRDRPEDVLPLAQHFLRLYSAKMGKAVIAIAPEARELLTLNPWLGNVRELENVIERAVVLTQKNELGVDDLPPEMHKVGKPAGDADFAGLAGLPFAQAKALTVSAFERRYLTTVLEKAGGNISQAALAAGMDRSNFRRLLREHEIVAHSTGSGPVND